MNNFTRFIITLASLLAIIFTLSSLIKGCETRKSTIKNEDKYASTFNGTSYQETALAKALHDVDSFRTKALRLQARLDTCEFGIKVKPVTNPVTYTKKKSKKLSDCEKEVMDLRAQIGDYIGKKAEMEVTKDLEINLLNRKLDTCSYYVREIDKALIYMSNDISKLTNQKDSLTVVLNTPIRTIKELPCLKVKKGAVLEGLIVPSNNHIAMGVLPLEKAKYKAAKKICKKQ